MYIYKTIWDCPVCNFVPQNYPRGCLKHGEKILRRRGSNKVKEGEISRACTTTHTSCHFRAGHHLAEFSSRLLPEIIKRS